MARYGDACPAPLWKGQIGNVDEVSLGKCLTCHAQQQDEKNEQQSKYVLWIFDTQPYSEIRR